MNGFEVVASKILIPENVSENGEFLSIFTVEEKEKYGLSYNKPETEIRTEDKKEINDDNIEHNFEIFVDKTENEENKSS